MLQAIGVKYKVIDEQMVSEKELFKKLGNKEVEYGIFESFTPGIGKMLSFALPPTQPDQAIDKDLQKIINIIDSKDYSTQNKQILHDVFKKNEFLRYYIIDMLMPKAFYLRSNPLHYKMANSGVDNIKSLLNVLIECGAKYEYIIYHPAVTAQDFEIQLKYFGDQRILNMMIANMPILIATNTGNINADAIRKTECMIKKGANINIKHQTDGTFLHVLVANENTKLALQYIDLLEKHHKNKFNYTSQDAEGKTLLLLATKLNQTATVKKLAELHSKKINIGLNIVDAQGRTPLLLAVALGNKEIVNDLLEMGADIHAVDNQGRGLGFYLNAPTEIVSEILKSIHVEPERHESAPHNWLYFNDQLARPLVYHGSNESEKRVLLSKQEKHLGLINLVLKEAKQQDKNLYEHLLKQIQPLLDKKGNQTVIEKCLKGRNDVASVIKSWKEHLLRKSCALGDLESVKSLVADGVDINARDSLERTPLHYTVMRQKLVQDTIKIPSDTNIEKCMHGHPEVFNFLASRGADIHAKNKNGNSPIAIIKRDKKGDAADVTELDKEIAAKIDVNLTNTNESTTSYHVAGPFSKLNLNEQSVKKSPSAGNLEQPPNGLDLS